MAWLVRTFRLTIIIVSCNEVRWTLDHGHRWSMGTGRWDQLHGDVSCYLHSIFHSMQELESSFGQFSVK